MERKAVADLGEGSGEPGTPLIDENTSFLPEGQEIFRPGEGPGLNLRPEGSEKFGGPRLYKEVRIRHW